MPGQYADADVELDGLRTAKDVGTALLLSFLFGFAAKRVEGFVRPDVDGRWYWLLLLGIAVFAFLASFAAQTRRRPLFWGAAVVVGVLALALPSQMAARDRAAEKPVQKADGPLLAGRPPVLDLGLLPLTDDDRAPLQPIERPEIQGETRWLCQWPLGVAVGGMSDWALADPEGAAAFAARYDEKIGQAGTAAWWAWKTSGNRVTLVVAKGGAKDAETFFRFAELLLETQTGRDYHSVIERSERQAAPYEFEVAAQDANANWRHFRCLGAFERTPEALAACLITDSSSPVELEKVRESLEIGPC